MNQPPHPHDAMPDNSAISPPAGEGAGYAEHRRDTRDFHHAKRHSGRVRILRIALPLAGALIVTVIFGAYLWSQSGGNAISMGSIGLENGRMVMRKPEINGVDGNQRPYSLTAREAVQDPASPAQIEFFEINAQVPLNDGLFARIVAGTGFYDSEKKALKLAGEVDVETDDGMTVRLQDADVDLAGGTLETTSPVSMKARQAKISADGLKIEDNGKRVVFDRRVKMTIYPKNIGN